MTSIGLLARAERATVDRAMVPGGPRSSAVCATGPRALAVELAERLDLSPEAVSRTWKRFLDGEIEALNDRPKAARKDHALTSETTECIVQLALSPPPPGRSHWTTRLLASRFGITSGAVSDVLRKNGLKPHLVRTYKVSRDPQFAAKVRDVVGLCLNPLEHAIVLGLDEKTSTQALERTQLPLPLAPRYFKPIWACRPCLEFT